MSAIIGIWSISYVISINYKF